MVTILQKNAELLRKIAKPVPLKDIGTARIQKIIADMKTAMHREDDAVAIAAPQIGVSLRIFVVSGKLFISEKNDDHEQKNKTLPPDLVYINPELTKFSQKKVWAEEGCLSVRWLYGEVRRSEKATIRAYDERGARVVRGASGILAQVFQHEIEHLDGILFIDKARNTQEIPPKKK